MACAGAWSVIQVGGHRQRKGDRPPRWAIVDAVDAVRLRLFRWVPAGKGYAARRIGPTTIWHMHREVMGIRPGDPRQVDHINRHVLDNRRANLRLAAGPDAPEQRQNTSSQRRSTSRFRGVGWDTTAQRWLAQVNLDGRVIFKRRFADEIEAARAADAVRLELLPFAEPDPELERLAA